MQALPTGAWPRLAPFDLSQEEWTAQKKSHCLQQWREAHRPLHERVKIDQGVAPIRASWRGPLVRRDMPCLKGNAERHDPVCRDRATKEFVAGSGQWRHVSLNAGLRLYIARLSHRCLIVASLTDMQPKIAVNKDAPIGAERRSPETVLPLIEEHSSARSAGDNPMKTFHITPDFDQRMTVLTLFLVALACAIIFVIVLGMSLDRRERKIGLRGDQLRPWNRRRPPE